MSKTTFYRQCHLVKHDGDATLHQTTWIPEAFAVIGKTLRLKEDGQWDEGWQVEMVGSTSRSEDLLPDGHHEAKGHRRATGDCLPRLEPRP